MSYAFVNVFFTSKMQDLCIGNYKATKDYKDFTQHFA